LSLARNQDAVCRYCQLGLHRLVAEPQLHHSQWRGRTPPHDLVF
jgi:hypothetical protein